MCPLDHTLEFGAAVVGGGSGFHEGFDEPIAARCAIGFALFALIGDRYVVFGLPRGGDARVEGGALGDIGTVHIHRLPPFILRRSINGNSRVTRSYSTVGTTF